LSKLELDINKWEADFGLCSEEVGRLTDSRNLQHSKEIKEGFKKIANGLTKYLFSKKNE
jgi:hypothetical protein